MNVFTDGACINNGKPNAKAGIGVFLSENDTRNVSRRVIGKQTNNVAELSVGNENADRLANMSVGL